MPPRRRAPGAIAAVLAAATVTGLVAPAPAAPAAPAVTVSPDADLTDGDRVEVTLTGLPVNDWFEVAQCRADPVDAFLDCDMTDTVFGVASAAGTATVELRVDAVIRTGYGYGDPGTEIDCRVAACAIGVEREAGAMASAPLAFAPGTPHAPPPAVTVTPDTDLGDLAAVEVEASGLVWSRYARIAQCAAPPAGVDDCDDATAMYAAVEPDGTLALDLAVLATIETYGRGEVDCREPGACVLAVSQDNLRTPAKSATAPLGFDPGAEVVPPTLDVAPATDLVDGQRVTLTGSGFPPAGPDGSWVEIQQCTDEPSWDTCTWVGWSAIDASGAFTTEVVVWATLGTGDGEVDCRAAPGTCQLVASRNRPDATRAGRVGLAFDPDGPLLPPPSIEVAPSSGLAGGDVVTVSGRDFTPDGWAQVATCERGSSERCDWENAAFVSLPSTGTFTVDLVVEEAFESWDGPVDCLDGDCVIAAFDEVRGRTASADIAFRAPVSGDRRYIDPVFDEVTVARGLVYREVEDAHGAPVRLTLDLYEPAGDTAAQRPVVAWFTGGWFGDGDGGRAAGFAEDLARRGYVVAVIEPRSRPDLDCCPSREAVGIAGAIADATADGAAAVEWLEQHAAEHRIDPRTTVAAGTEGGGAVAFGLAYPGFDRGRPGHHAAGGTAVAAALPVSGVAVGEPAAGAPPVLAFHGGDDLTAPAHLSEWTCAAAAEVGDRCDVVSYAGAGGEISASRKRDIVNRSTAFLAEVILGPLGYLDDGPLQTTTTTAAPATTESPEATTTTTAAAPRGDLPRTGADGTAALVRIGVAAAALGAALVGLAAHRRRRTDATGSQGV
ncbi:MAG TPA: neocarzinostatin apoprotein domain-containing protein [Acidimicrobiales bacterium]